MARVSVTDHGTGIEASEQAGVFEKFRQVGSPRTATHSGGTGLGLAIARQLIQTQGGSVGVISDIGYGATFWFEIPTIGPATA